MTEIFRLGRLAPMDERKQRIQRLLEAGPVVPLRDLLQEIKVLGKGGMKSVAVYMKYPQHPEEPGKIAKTSVYAGSLWKYTPPNKGKWGAQIVDPPEEDEDDESGYAGGGVEIPDHIIHQIKGQDLKFHDLLKLPGSKTPDGKKVPDDAPMPPAVSKGKVTPQPTPPTPPEPKPEPKPAAVAPKAPEPAPTPPKPAPEPPKAAPPMPGAKVTFEPPKPPPTPEKQAHYKAALDVMAAADLPPVDLPAEPAEEPPPPPPAPKKEPSKKLSKAKSMIALGATMVMGAPPEEPKVLEPKHGPPVPGPAIPATVAAPVKIEPLPKVEPPPPPPKVEPPPVAAAPVEPPPKPVKVPSVDKLPSPADMQFVKSGKYLGGAGEKDIYEKGGKQYIFKLAMDKSGSTSKPYAALAQEAAAKIASKLKPEAFVPVKSTSDEKGRIGTVQPLLDLDKPPTLAGMDPAKLTDTEKKDLAEEHVLDFLFSQHDSHGANLLRVGGRILGVDKEQAFKYFPEDELDTDYHPNAMYGENEPYYNTFWKAFSAGKVDFDPKKLADIFDRLDGISAADYKAALAPYAASLWGGKPEKQEEFLKAALHRKLSMRGKFEKFISARYKERTGKEGSFSFETGWLEKGKAPPKQMIKKPISEVATEAGFSVKPWMVDGKEDKDYYTLRTSKSTSDAKILDFLKSVGVEAHSGITAGGQYKHIKIKRSDYDLGTKEIEVEPPKVSAVSPTPSKPKYFPEVEPHKEITSNFDEVKALPKKKMGPHGARISVDGPLVEGQTATIRRHIGTDGKPYYRVWMKLRSGTGVSLSSLKGDVAHIDTQTAAYSAEKDAVVDQGESALMGHGQITAHMVHSSPEAKVYFSADARQTFKDVLCVDIRGDGVSDPAAALKKALETVSPKIAKEVLRNPTPKEREVRRLTQLLWAYSPEKADGLKKADFEPETLKALLADAGLDPEDIGKLKEIETLPGHSSVVLPGRYKKLKAKFSFTGRGGPDALVSILQNGLMGGGERVQAGVPLQFGDQTSASQDLGTGGGDYVPTHIVSDKAYDAGVPFSSFSFCDKGDQFFVIEPPDELDRLDIFQHSHDLYLTTKGSDWAGRKPLHKSIEAMNTGYGSGGTSYEAGVKKGVSRKRFLRIAVKEETTRAKLLAAAKKAGFQEFNGVPIEDFIVVCKTPKEAYKKYIEPLGY